LRLILYRAKMRPSIPVNVATVIVSLEAFVALPTKGMWSAAIEALRNGAILMAKKDDRSMEEVLSRPTHCLVINTDGAVYNAESHLFATVPQYDVPVFFDPTVKTLLYKILAKLIRNLEGGMEKELYDVLKAAATHEVYVTHHAIRTDCVSYWRFNNAEAAQIVAFLDAHYAALRASWSGDRAVYEAHVAACAVSDGTVLKAIVEAQTAAVLPSALVDIVATTHVSALPRGGTEYAPSAAVGGAGTA